MSLFLRFKSHYKSYLFLTCMLFLSGLKGMSPPEALSHRSLPYERFSTKDSSIQMEVVGHPSLDIVYSDTAKEIEHLEDGTKKLINTHFKIGNLEDYLKNNPDKNHVLICGLLRGKNGHDGFYIPRDILKMLEKYAGFNIEFDIENELKKTGILLEKRIQHIDKAMAYCEKENEFSDGQYCYSVLEFVCIFSLLFFIFPGLMTAIAFLTYHYISNLHIGDLNTYRSLAILISTELLLLFLLICCCWHSLYKGEYCRSFPRRRKKLKMAQVNTCINEEGEVWEQFEGWVVECNS